MTSQRKSEANRANAQLSTGPRSASGRARASQNALRHGLSVAPPADLMSSAASAIAAIIIAEGIDCSLAYEISARILDYERHLSHERQAFASQFVPTKPDPDAHPVTDGQDVGLQLLSKLGQHGLRRLSKDEKDAFKLNRSALKLLSKVETQKKKEKAATTARYYRRASNQLIRSLKGAT
jgi:hypothetical protein